MNCNYPSNSLFSNIDFNEAAPALFGFQEVWVPLKLNIYINSFKVLGHAPYSHNPEAAYLDPCGAEKLFTNNEQEHLSESGLSKQSQNDELIQKIRAVQYRFFMTSKIDANKQLFDADILQRSKKAIVDFVQENIKKYYIMKNQKLTRIIFGLELEITGNSLLDTNFTPRLQAVINKKKDSYTAAEIRMAYKLMKEIPDEDIQYIANQSIRFVKVIKTITNEYRRGGTTFNVKFIAPPWLNQEAEWANRTRKEGRDAYEKRKENLPDWITRLISYKNEMKALSMDDVS